MLDLPSTHLIDFPKNGYFLGYIKVIDLFKGEYPPYLNFHSYA